MRREGVVFALVGPAGGGKTTFCRKLIEEFPDTLKLSVSATTRDPRPGEVNGISKHFITRAQFEDKIKKSEFFEWEDVHGQLYGQLNSTIDETIHSGFDLLLDIDFRGAMTFKQRLQLSTVICVVVPPSFAELERRIVNRSPVSADELKARLATAAVEYRNFLKLAGEGSIDYLVINDDRDTAYGLIRAQLLAERSRVSRLNSDDLGKLCSIDT